MIDVQAASDAWQRADKLALYSLVVTVVGIAIAIRTLWCSNLNASVATASALMVDIQNALNEYIRSIPNCESNQEHQNEMPEKLEFLMNRLEMASAVCVERSLYGISLTLVRNYVKDVLKVILRNEYVCAEAGKLLQDDDTFKYIRWFMGFAPRGSIRAPDGWYVRYRPAFLERVRVKFGLAGW